MFYILTVSAVEEKETSSGKPDKIVILGGLWGCMYHIYKQYI